MSLSTTVLTLLSLDASQQLKNLLENKHLYQKTELDVKAIVGKVEKQATTKHDQETPSPVGIYRAVIAFNSGKILAALFYLRTFIEQFARRVTGLTGKVTGDEILDDYYKSLPAPTRDEMPSLREWYDKLSDALHSAREDAPLFETAKTQIEKHFDIRRVFNIPEKMPVAKPAEPAAVATEAPSSLQ